MKAQTFGIKGSQALLKAMWKELGELGYDVSNYEDGETCNNISNNWQSNEKNLESIEKYKSLFIGTVGYSKLKEQYDVVFELPQQYNEALAFAKEQLEDKYWVKTPQKWDVGTFAVFLKDYGGYSIGTVSEIIEKTETCVKVKAPFNNVTNCKCELYYDTEAKWFATRKEAEEFAETLKLKSIELPKFKVGDYVTNGINTAHIGRIMSITGDTFNYWGFDGSDVYFDNGTLFFSPYHRLTTPKEIEEFLIRVAKLKGFIKGVKYHPINCDTRKTSNNILLAMGQFNYYNNDDILCFNGNIYVDGIWASIIPNEIILPFGNLEFTINKEKQFAKCDMGVITKYQINSIVKHLQTSINLLGYDMEIGGNTELKFGCCKGTLLQAEEILKAFD